MGEAVGKTVFVVVMCILTLIGSAVVWVLVKDFLAKKKKWLALAAHYGFKSQDAGKDHAWMEGTVEGLTVEIDRSREMTRPGSASTFTRVTAYPQYPAALPPAGRMKRVLSDRAAQASVKAFLGAYNQARVIDDSVTCANVDPLLDVDVIEETVTAVVKLCLELQEAAQRVVTPATPPPVPVDARR